jgi:phospholipid/cholesterol/gamma-HCH transport system substrate-binding protein
MRRDTINYLVVGTFVLGIFILFMVVLYQITGRTGPTENYYVSYGRVEGIEKGRPVLYEGYPVGQVDAVEPIREGAGIRFRVTLAVKKDWKIPADSVAVVTKSGLLASVAINIEAGKSMTSLAPESVIQGEEAADLFSTINDVAADLRALSRDSLRPLLDNLNSKVDLLGGDLHGIMQDSLRPILDEQVKVILRKVDKTTDQLNVLLGDRNVEHVNEILANLNSSSDNLRQLLADLQTTRATLDRALTNIDGVVDENDEDIRRTVYTISQHIEAVSHNLEASSRNMNEFSRQIRENPGLLLRNSPQPEDEKSP